MVTEMIQIIKRGEEWKLRHVWHEGHATIFDGKFDTFCKAVKAGRNIARAYRCDLVVEKPQQPLELTADLPAEWFFVVNDVNARLAASEVF